MFDSIILEYEGKFGRGRTVDDIVGWVETLPPMPDVVTKALKLVDDLDSTPQEIATVLAHDPALVSVILRTANSAALGRAETVSSLDEAIQVVGISHLKSLLLGLTLKKWNQQFDAVDQMAWEKSLSTGAAATVVATALRKNFSSTARLCGLLHNLGQVIMLSRPEVRREYPAVLDYIRDHEVDFAEAEREVIGFSHPLIGAMVARKWQLPFSLCNTILHYADPFEGIDSPQDEQIAITKFAAALSQDAGKGCPPGHPRAGASLDTLAGALGFDRATLKDTQTVLIGETTALYAAEASIFQ